MDVFKEIVEANQNKFIVGFARLLDEKLDLEDAGDLSMLVELAYIHYIIGEKETALQLAKLTYEVEFTNNFDIWTWAEFSLALMSLLHKENDGEELSKNCIAKISAVVESKPLNKKIFNRFLNGSTLDYKKIENAQNEDSEYHWRKNQLQKLILIHEMGGGEEFSIERAKEEIQENLDRLKVLVDIFGE